MAKLKPERTAHLKTPRSSHNTTSNLPTPTSIPPLSQSLSSIHTNTGTPTAGPKQRGRKRGSKNIPLIPASTATPQHLLHVSDFEQPHCRENQVSYKSANITGQQTASSLPTVKLVSSSSGRCRTASTKLAMIIEDDLATQSTIEQKAAKANLRCRKKQGVGEGSFQACRALDQ